MIKALFAGEIIFTNNKWRRRDSSSTGIVFVPSLSKRQIHRISLEI